MAEADHFDHWSRYLMFTEVERISSVADGLPAAVRTRACVRACVAVAVLVQCGGTTVGRLSCVTGVCCETGWSCV